MHSSELNSQITNTSKAIHVPTPSKGSAQSSDRKSNVVVYGVEESPPNTPRGVCLKEVYILSVSKILNIEIVPSQILDCYRLGKYKLLQP